MNCGYRSENQRYEKECKPSALHGCSLMLSNESVEKVSF